LPNVGPYIYDVSISGFTRSSIYIYIYDICSLRVNRSSQKQNRTCVGTCAAGVCVLLIAPCYNFRIQSTKCLFVSLWCILGVRTVYAISETTPIHQEVTLKSFSDKYRNVSVWIRRRKLTTDVMCFVQIREERWNFIPNIHAYYPYISYPNPRFPLGPIPNAVASSISGVENLALRPVWLLLVRYTHIH